MISFKSKKALNYLLKHGLVYTLRPFKRKEGITALLNEKDMKIGLVEVKFITELNSENLAESLKDFVGESGFKSVEEWINEAKKLLRGNLPERLYLYQVKLLKLFYQTLQS